MSHKAGPGTPNKGQQQPQMALQQANLVTSLGTMQPMAQMTNIAPAPAQTPMTPGQQAGGMAMATAAGAPGTPQQAQQLAQPMSAQVGQPLSTGQFQVIQQQPYVNSPTGTPQYAAVAQPFAYNQQPGQFVLPAGFALQPGMQMAQQPGQQQFILTGTNMATAQAPASAGQKPAQANQQSVVATSMAQNAAAAKQAPPMSQAYTISSNAFVTATGASGAPQTFIMASPMPQQQTQQPMTSMASQVKDAKQGAAATNPVNSQMTQQPIMSNAPTAAPGQQQQPLLVQQGGMTTFLSAAPQGQAFMQNGQLILRAPTPAGNQDATQPQQSLMFSPPLGQANQMQAMPQQMATTSMAGMQPVTMPVASGAMKPPANVSTQQTPTGKKALPPILPTGGQPRTSMASNLQPQQPSPKSKQKMSPRTGSILGRPPGPAKSVLNNIKSTSVSGTMSPPRLPGSPLQTLVPTQTAPAPTGLMGPPMLQSSQPGVMPPTSQQTVGGLTTSFAQPPKLQPMMPGLTTLDKAETKTEPKDESGPKQAVVKPHVMAHYIDGHQILESSAPFPIDKEDKGKYDNIRKVLRTVSSGNEFFSACVPHTCEQIDHACHVCTQ